LRVDGWSRAQQKQAAGQSRACNRTFPDPSRVNPLHIRLPVAKASACELFGAAVIILRYNKEQRLTG
jgi:hypothetical protein